MTSPAAKTTSSTSSSNQIATYRDFAAWAAGAPVEPFLKSLAAALGLPEVQLSPAGKLVIPQGYKLGGPARKFLGELRARVAEVLHFRGELEKRGALLREMSAKLLDLEETSRREISRRLHDDAGQTLVCIHLSMELLQRSTELPPQIVEQLAEIQQLTERSVREVRSLISELSPRVLDQSGLASAVRQFVSRLQQDYGLDIGLEIQQLNTLSNTLESAAYRIIQDCALELAQGFSAPNVNIFLGMADGVLKLRISGSGIRFPQRNPTNAGGSFRLKALQLRVALLGGACEFVRSRRGKKLAEQRTGGVWEAIISLPMTPI